MGFFYCSCVVGFVLTCVDMVEGEERRLKARREAAAASKNP